MCASWSHLAGGVMGMATCEGTLGLDPKSADGNIPHIWLLGHLGIPWLVEIAPQRQICFGPHETEQHTAASKWKRE